jgi:hypothetical protein
VPAATSVVQSLDIIEWLASPQHMRRGGRQNISLTSTA